MRRHRESKHDPTYKQREAEKRKLKAIITPIKRGGQYKCSKVGNIVFVYFMTDSKHQLSNQRLNVVGLFKLVMHNFTRLKNSKILYAKAAETPKMIIFYIVIAKV